MQKTSKTHPTRNSILLLASPKESFTDITKQFRPWLKETSVIAEDAHCERSKTPARLEEEVVSSQLCDSRMSCLRDWPGSSAVGSGLTSDLPRCFPREVSRFIVLSSLISRIPETEFHPSYKTIEMNGSFVTSVVHLWWLTSMINFVTLTFNEK